MTTLSSLSTIRAMTTTDLDILHQVTTTLGDDAAEFDVAGLVRKYLETFGRIPIDSVPPERYWPLVEQFDNEVAHHRTDRQVMMDRARDVTRAHSGIARDVAALGWLIGAIGNTPEPNVPSHTALLDLKAQAAGVEQGIASPC